MGTVGHIGLALCRLGQVHGSGRDFATSSCSSRGQPWGGAIGALAAADVSRGPAATTAAAEPGRSAQLIATLLRRGLAESRLPHSATWARSDTDSSSTTLNLVERAIPRRLIAASDVP
jgi:hypothetical protein